MSDPVLTVVMPVRNEADVIEGVLANWMEELSKINVPYVLQVYDDGSDDGTSEILTRLASQQNPVRISTHPRRGHGPSILRGYSESVTEWTMHVDSDGEIPAEEFHVLWVARDGADLVLGARAGRGSSILRRMVSAGARLIVRAGFGTEVRDANCPFRLIRKSLLDATLPLVPSNAFAPNVLMVGAAGAGGWRIVERTVRSFGRTGRASSLNSLRLFRAVIVSTVQTVGVAIRVKRSVTQRRRHAGSG